MYLWKFLFPSFYKRIDICEMRLAKLERLLVSTNVYFSELRDENDVRRDAFQILKDAYDTRGPRDFDDDED